MSNKQKNTQVQTVAASSAPVRATLAMPLPMPLPVGSPASFHVDAGALSRLGADLPTIQALLGNQAIPSGADSPTLAAVQPGAAETVDRSAADVLLNHSPEWMAAIGRIGGLSRSPAKSRAARLNGAKGGRPRKADPRSAVGSQGTHEVVRITSGNSLAASNESMSDAS